MIRPIYILLIIIICGCSGEEEPLPLGPKTYAGNVKLLSQIQVDEFGEQGYEVITGSLSLSPNTGANRPNNITDLTPLAQIKSVRDLNIINNAQLTSLEGLGNLEVRNSITIGYNGGITTLNPLQFSDSLSIYIVEPLVNLEPLRDLQDLKDLWITNYQGNDLDDLGSLRTAEYFRIAACSNVTDLAGLENLEHVTRLYIYDNDKLLSIKGLQSLNSTVRGLEVTFNNNLTDYCDLHPNLYREIYTSFNKYNPYFRDFEEGRCSL